MHKPVKCRFLHLADCHLGFEQYGSRDRHNDFSRAFQAIVETALQAQVDFVLLAGDLFHKRAVDALTLTHAIRVLSRLQQAGIPCIAVEGNHEKPYYGDQLGWVDFLARQELLILLNSQVNEQGARLTPYNRGAGAYFDPVPGVRVYGLPYMGASTQRALEMITHALGETPGQGGDYTIFIAHTGIEGVLPEQMGGLSLRELAPLRTYVDYLALGHVHKPFTFDDWIYNPGSPETCSMSEQAWPERGYYLVEVETPPDDHAPKHRATLHANPRRPFHRLAVKVDLHTSPAALYSHCSQLIERRARDLQPHPAADPSRRPVVELQLTGVLPFDRSGLDLAALQQLVERHFQPLLVRIKDQTRATEFAVAEGERDLSRAQLELQILVDLVSRDSRFQQRSAEWAHLALQLKQLALSAADPETILAELAARAAQLTQTETGGR